MILSIAIAILASFTGLSLASRAHASSGKMQRSWLAAAALVLGGGIWSMHFVAMLAFSMPGMVMNYDVGLTLLSLGLAVGFTGTGFAVASSGLLSLRRVITAGMLMGLGVLAMHYTGMAAMRMDATLSYGRAWLAISALIAISAATAALWLTSRDHGIGRQGAAAIVMGIAIAGMHFAGMKAATFTARTHFDAGQGGMTLGQTYLAVAISAFTIFILLMALGAAALERALSAYMRRQARIAMRLRISDILRAEDTEEALQQVAVSLGEHFSVSRTGFGELRQAEGVFDYDVCWTDGSVPPLLGRLPAADFGVKIVGELGAGRTVAIDDLLEADLSDETLTRETARDVDTRSILVVPFRRGGQLHTIVYLNGRTPRHWRTEEIEFMEELAERIRLVIERNSAEAQLRELNATLEARVETRTHELQEAEAARREADLLYRAYFENTPDPLFVVRVEPAGAFIAEQINPAHETGVGFKLEEIRGKRVDEFLSDEAAERATAAYRHVVATRRIYHYREFFRLSGDPQQWDTTLIPLLGDDGQVERIIGSSRDVTRQLAAEEALRQAQKMEAMGQLTGGVAHDFNNLLTPIMGALDRLDRKGLGDERDRKFIAAALQSADRAKTLVHRLLSFARRQPLQPVPVDISTLVAGITDLISSTLGPQIDLMVDAPGGLPAAVADPNQLEMALLNLSVNARDAMPNGGTLRVSVSQSSVVDDEVSTVPGGHYICLCVTDTGTGMDDETQKRAIEPFYSTKGLGRGTGLGLSMAHGLAAQLGGALTIDSTPGRGTTICIWLPASGENVIERYDAPAPTIASFRGGTAILVDDEDLVRESAAQMLSDLGFNVKSTTSATEAQSLIDEGIEPDLLITDHLMPGMTGTELARSVLRQLPGTEVLIMSGYADAKGIDPDLPRLTKPFRQADLAAALRQLWRGRSELPERPIDGRREVLND
ncbi:MHYT domain-containing protein [Sphingobium herbicidovorans]|uniref:MHYT domain-containing protein n=1 Tax=Sphingobium herbicidovorans TaxID=76947 RepID=UPI001E5D78DE|nr:MHYT domain-containing protein [Sphingobium herbicidovorans]